MNAKNTHLKSKILENAKKTTIDYYKKMQNYIDTHVEQLNNQIDFLLKEYFENHVSSRTADNLYEDNNRTLKEKYHFPDVLRVGDLINIIKPISNIINDSWVTKIPMYIPIREQHLAILLDNKHKNRIIAVLESNVIKMMDALPDGLVKVSIIDKNGAGQNFPALFGLHEKITDSTILSDDVAIEDTLRQIKSKMKVVAQAISANGFNSIEEYNIKTDEVPQPYQFIVINAFPNGFSKKAVEDIQSIIESGHKAGIYVFMTVEYNKIFILKENLYGMQLSTILKNANVLKINEIEDSIIVGEGYSQDTFELLATPLKNEKEMINTFNSRYRIIIPNLSLSILRHKVSLLNDNIKNININPIIKLSKKIPPIEEWWKKDASSGVSLGFGKKGIETAFFNIGINQYNENVATHHALIAASTGSGKTVFIHDLITAGIMNYSPKALNFWLLDYKEGTEFALYKDAKHVTILSMESEVDFGHQVFEESIKIMEERGALFKELSVSNLTNCNKKLKEQGKEILPRILIIVDEFQELYPKGNPKIARVSNALINAIVRKGRSFGINIILSTQTIRGLDIDTDILSNIPLRVGMMMQEADSKAIFNENNVAASYCTKPGEGVLNSHSGDLKYNEFFQAYFANNDDVKQVIQTANELMDKKYDSLFLENLLNNRFIYVGNTPGDINTLKQCCIEKDNKVYIGEPSGLTKKHPFVSFEQKYGDNMLIVGSNEKMALNIFKNIILQYSYNQNFSSEGVDFYIASLKNNMNKKVKEIEQYKIDGKNQITIYNIDKTKQILDIIYNELENRLNDLEKDTDKKFKPLFNMLFFVEAYDIQQEDSFSSKYKQKYLDIIEKGSNIGIYTIIYSLQYNGISDLSRNLSKFGKKIVLNSSSFETDVRILSNNIDEIKPSKSPNVAIMQGDIGAGLTKVKPYLNIDTKFKKVF